MPERHVRFRFVSPNKAGGRAARKNITSEGARAPSRSAIVINGRYVSPVAVDVVINFRADGNWRPRTFIAARFSSSQADDL